VLSDGSCDEPGEDRDDGWLDWIIDIGLVVAGSIEFVLSLVGRDAGFESLLLRFEIVA
jgi:hypothetical protein